MTQKVSVSLFLGGFCLLFFVLSGFVNHDSVVRESIGRIAAEHGIDLSAAREAEAVEETLDSEAGEPEDSVEAREFSSRSLKIRMPLSGTIARVDASAGTLIKAGQRLLTVDDTLFKQTIISLKQRMAVLRKETDTWQNIISSFNGIRALQIYGVLPEIICTSQILAAKIHHMEYLNGEIQCNEAMVESCELRAQEDAMVDRVAVKEGQVVPGGAVVLHLRPFSTVARSRR